MLKPSDYVLASGGQGINGSYRNGLSTRCLPGLTSHRLKFKNQKEVWILGLVFLRNFEVKFDFERQVVSLRDQEESEIIV